MDKYVDISGNAAYLRRRAAFDALFVPACRASADIRKPYRFGGKIGNVRKMQKEVV